MFLSQETSEWNNAVAPSVLDCNIGDLFRGKQLAAMYGTVSKGTALTAEEIVKATQRVFPNRINALAGKGSSPEKSKSFAHLPTPGSVFEPAYDRHGNIILDVTYPQFLDAMGRVALACYSMPPYRYTHSPSCCDLNNE